jgi:hypothetical protein
MKKVLDADTSTEGFEIQDACHQSFKSFADEETINSTMNAHGRFPCLNFLT